LHHEYLFSTAAYQYYSLMASCCNRLTGFFKTDIVS
jgi:hypothetical protein